MVVVLRLIAAYVVFEIAALVLAMPVHGIAVAVHEYFEVTGIRYVYTIPMVTIYLGGLIAALYFHKKVGSFSKKIQLLICAPLSALLMIFVVMERPILGHKGVQSIEVVNIYVDREEVIVSANQKIHNSFDEFTKSASEIARDSHIFVVNTNSASNKDMLNKIEEYLEQRKYHHIVEKGNWEMNDILLK